MTDRPPLELTVYPLCTDADCPAGKGADPHYAAPIGMFTWYADDKAAQKRLTEPELAAEMFRALGRACAESGLAWAPGDPDSSEILITPGDAVTVGPVRLETQRAIDVHRIATRPHAAEHDYE